MKRGIPISYYCLHAQFYLEKEDKKSFRLYIYKPFVDKLTSPDLISASCNIVHQDFGFDQYACNDFWEVEDHKIDPEVWLFWFNSVAHHLKSDINFKAEYLTTDDCRMISNLGEQPEIQINEFPAIEEPWIEIKNNQILDYSFCNLTLFTQPKGDFQSIMAQMVRNHKSFVNKLNNKNKTKLFERLYYSVG